MRIYRYMYYCIYFEYTVEDCAQTWLLENTIFFDLYHSYVEGKVLIKTVRIKIKL